MTGKDVLKLLLCLYGYDRNIKIETYRGEGGCIGYDVSAEDKEGDYYEEVNCDGLLFHMSCIIDYMKKNEVGCFFSGWTNYDIKSLLNDTTRNEAIALRDKREEEADKQWEKIKPVYDWRDANNPCPNCSINKKDHWDDIHYNCELNHNYSCSILIDFQNELTKKLSEANKL